MTSNMKCPFCETELEQGIELLRGGHILGCPKCKRNADDIFWFALIQAKRDLETAKADIEDYKKYKALWEQIRNNTILELERKLKIATKALDWLGNNRLAENPVRVEQLRRYARNALEQIEHKE